MSRASQLIPTNKPRFRLPSGWLFHATLQCGRALKTSGPRRHDMPLLLHALCRPKVDLGKDCSRVLWPQFGLCSPSRLDLGVGVCQAPGSGVVPGANTG